MPFTGRRARVRAAARRGRTVTDAVPEIVARLAPLCPTCALHRVGLGNVCPECGAVCECGQAMWGTCEDCSPCRVEGCWQWPVLGRYSCGHQCEACGEIHGEHEDSCDGGSPRV